MENINFGCQLYTWQMSGQKYIGKLSHILDIVKTSGFAAIEPDTIMLGPFFDNPSALGEKLEEAGIKISSLFISCSWKSPSETDAERQLADKAINFLKNFPGTQLATGLIPGDDRSGLSNLQKNAIACINDVARRASMEGLQVSFHPNSPEGSLFRTLQDYEILWSGLDTRIIGFCPDSGHIVKGGMEVLEIFKQYISIIKNVHFKDISSKGEWVGMGQGIINFPEIVKFLASKNYRGWILIEEESREAEADPDQAVRQNGKYISDTLIPVIRDYRK